MLKKPAVRYTLAAILIALPVVLLALPVDYFDSGESVCLSRSLFDVECYACGMTRGIMHLIHFDFAGAAAFNKLSFVVLPLVGLLWLKALLAQFEIRILRWF